MLFDPAELSRKACYKFVIGAIQPRPIAWVSTVAPDGTLNVAPYSFFTAASVDPFVLMFCPQVPAVGERKDTLNNIRALPEFVINITNEETMVAMSKSAALLPPDQSEFEYAGLTAAPSQTISVPRVAEAPLAFECKLRQIVEIGVNPFGGAVVFGDVTMIYAQEGVIVDGYVVREALRPIGRLAGNEYVRVTDVFEMLRG
jgi:flavin reductase (DIM6/NTAB) family NADH-FMN oxidoreductase RutF